MYTRRNLFRTGFSQLPQWLARSRLLILALGHLTIFTFVLILAFGLRFDFAIPPFQIRAIVANLPWILAIKLTVFYFWGQYHGWWSYVTFSDLTALVRAATISLLVLIAVERFFLRHPIPGSILALDYVLTIAVFGALRASWRMVQEQFWPWFQRDPRRPVLLVGADRQHGMLANQINSHLQLEFRIDGLLASNGEATGLHLGRLVVCGHLDELPRIATERKVREVLVTAGMVPGAQLRHLADVCEANQLDLRIIPQIEDLYTGNGQIPVRSLEISDLLQREPVRLDDDLLSELLGGRRVLVTGAGGSIGSEICRQTFRYQPAELILLGRGENRIFAIDRELREHPPRPAQPQSSAQRPMICPVIGDVTDESRMRQVFEQYRPEIVFHAAAHKHVPLMENSVSQAVKNNVLGTRIVADLTDEYDAKAFVLISTDKAVHPTSVMGTTKHLAERYVHSLGSHSVTRFLSVRFGNVLGSAGSVVPTFQEQIRRGGPITLTDSRMTRYFMTIPEATQLVLQAAAMGEGGEIFVLDMGQPVRIIDLARDLIRLSGLPENAIEIQEMGIRPGEKLYEELYFSDETSVPTSHRKLRAARHRPWELADTQQQIARLQSLIDAPDEVIRKTLEELVPEYQAPCRIRQAEPVQQLAVVQCMEALSNRRFSEETTGQLPLSTQSSPGAAPA